MNTYALKWEWQLTVGDAESAQLENARLENNRQDTLVS